MSVTELNQIAAQWAPCLLRACGQGSLAIAGVWCLCRLLPRLSPGVRALLWWLACAKTLLSVALPGPLSLAVLPAAPTLPPVAVTTPRTALPAPEVVVPSSMSFAPVPLTPAAPTADALSLTGALLCLWLVGIAALLMRLLRERRAIGRAARAAAPCGPTPAIHDVARAVGLNRVPRVLVSDQTDGSLVLGFWRTAVLLCRTDLERLSAQELRALLAHELTHIRRHDLWSGLLPSATRVLFFFHPLVWLACREYDLAREAVCDAEALRVSGLAPVDYGRLVLKLSLASAAPRAGLTTLGVASPQGQQLRRRLLGLQRLGRKHSLLSHLGSGLALGATVIALCLHPVRVTASTAPALPAPTVAAHPAPVALPLPPQKGTRPMTIRPLGIVPKPAAALAAVALAAPVIRAQAPPPVLPTPAAPAAPVILAPIAPVVPAEPAPPASTQTRYQYTLRQGDSYSTRTTDRAVATAQRALAKAQPGDCLVVDRDGKRYLITDPETLQRARENYAAVEAIGKQMEATGKQMEDASKPLETLGKQMEAIGKQMEEIGKQMEAQGQLLAAAVQEGKPETERQAIQEQMRALQQQMKAPQEEMRQLSQKMREQSTRFRPQSNQLREQGARMRTAIKNAEENMGTILDNAFKNNLAVEQKR